MSKRTALLCHACLLLATLWVGAGVAVHAEEPIELEAAPPWIFFDEPDEETAEEIENLVMRSFADLNRVVAARAALVERFGLWSIPRLELELIERNVEPRMWNAALTLYALRDRYGSARELWAPIESLVTILETSPEPYRRAFACLALGSYHGPGFVPEATADRDPLLVSREEDVAKRWLSRALGTLSTAVTDDNIPVRVAASLALGKWGGSEARAPLHPVTAGDAATEARMAYLMAIGLLPRDDDDTIFLEALGRPERKDRRAAALAVSLQVLCDDPPAWVASTDRIRRALSTEPIRMQLEDGAEAVFTRGCLVALGHSEPAEWRELLTVAIKPSTDFDTATAAAQGLLFCNQPWFLSRAYRLALGGNSLKESVLAMFLLRLGASGTADGLEACDLYLKNPARVPRGKAEWDVRYHACVGILRALADGRIKTPELKQEYVAALERAVKRGLPEGPFQAALAHVLEHERATLLQDPFYALPHSRVLDVQRTFRDPNALLSRDLIDVVVHRLNALMPIVFAIDSLRPGPPGQPNRTDMPQRFLKACLDEYPYFSRLELRADRGLRPPSTMLGADTPQMEIRK